MKELFITLSILLNTIFSVNAQSNEPIYSQVDKVAAFPGGIPKLFKFIADNLKYPEQAVNANISGKVMIKMIIEKDGSVSSTTILKSVGYGCDEEAERVVKAMPKWTAGKVDGKDVRSTFVIPIMFVLDNGKRAK